MSRLVWTNKGGKVYSKLSDIATPHLEAIVRILRKTAVIDDEFIAMLNPDNEDDRALASVEVNRFYSAKGKLGAFSRELKRRDRRVMGILSHNGENKWK